jgi:hypothetical protein
VAFGALILLAVAVPEGLLAELVVLVALVPIELMVLEMEGAEAEELILEALLGELEEPRELPAEAEEAEEVA